MKPRMAETRKKMEARKQNAMSAFKREHTPLPVMPFQFHMLPHFMGPMKLAKRPKATMKPTNSNRSTGQWTKLEAKGIKKTREKRMPIAAMTSV